MPEATVITEPQVAWSIALAKVKYGETEELPSLLVSCPVVATYLFPVGTVIVITFEYWEYEEASHEAARR